MILETYRATVTHDKGIVRFRVVSLSGKKGAIEQIMAAEGCPRRAIIKIIKIGKSKIL